ncbi:Uncharacterized protein FKW44_023851, partial [Caligus rogercresseyi]
ISGTLIQLEHSHARALQDKHEANASILHSDSQGSSELLQSRLASDLSNVRDTQYREFREWVMRVHEEFQEGKKPDIARSGSSFSIEASPSAPRLQESFTITLGAQMKQMHNLRLVAAEVLELCRYPSPMEDSSSPNAFKHPCPSTQTTSAASFSSMIRALSPY